MVCIDSSSLEAGPCCTCDFIHDSFFLLSFVLLIISETFLDEQQCTSQQRHTASQNCASESLPFPIGWFEKKGAEIGREAAQRSSYFETSLNSCLEILIQTLLNIAHVLSMNEMEMAF